MLKLKQKTLTFIENHPRLAQILSTPELREDASLYLASGISFAFTIFCIISGIFSNARWFMTLGIYNFVLALIRIIPAADMRRQIKNPRPEEQRIRHESWLCMIIGISLLSINLIFIGITAETIIRNNALHYHPVILFILVPFSFIRFIVLSIGTIRKRKEGATLNHSLRIINMTVALVSLYTTQTAVLDTYMSNELLRLAVNLISSSLIFFVLFRIAVNLILAARNELKPEMKTDE